MFVKTFRCDRQIRALPACIAALALLLSSLGFYGCASSRQVADAAGSEMDLTERFSLVSPAAPEALQKHLSVTRKGDSRDALVLVAPAVVRASLQGVAGRRILKFWAAPVFNVGDGVQMGVFLKRAGTRISIAGRYFDPARKSEDRNWIPFTIPLEISGGDQLEIEASAGPQGEPTADWLAMSALRLTR